jgi:hypothetical protein
MGISAVLWLHAIFRVKRAPRVLIGAQNIASSLCNPASDGTSRAKQMLERFK